MDPEDDDITSEYEEEAMLAALEFPPHEEKTMFDYEGFFGPPMNQLQRSKWERKTRVERGTEDDFGKPVLVPGGRFYPSPEPPGDGFTKEGFLAWAVERGMEQGKDDNGDYVKWPDPPRPE